MSSRLSRLLRQHRALANSSPQELVMQRITLAPVAGATGNTKAVKRPETFAVALELALEKEVLAGGAKPARLFFPDGGEIEADSWELVADKDTVYVSAGDALKPPTSPAAVPNTPAAPANVMMPMMRVPMPVTYGETLAARNAAYEERVAKIHPQTDKLAQVCLALHIVGYIVGHLPFFIESMRSINDTTGNTAFVLFVFIPSTAIWGTGLSGCLLIWTRVTKSMGSGSEEPCCGGCCVDRNRRPNFSCAITLLIIALCLHGIIAYIETFLIANFQSWVLGVLIAKNGLCIVAEIVGLCVACRLVQAAKDPQPGQAVGAAALPMAVMTTSATAATPGEAV